MKLNSTKKDSDVQFVRLWPAFAAQYELTQALIFSVIYWHVALSDIARAQQRKFVLEKADLTEFEKKALEKLGLPKDLRGHPLQHLTGYFYLPFYVKARISYSKIARRTGLSLSTVKRGVRKLVDKTAIKVTNDGGVNLYEIPEFDLDDVLLDKNDIGLYEPKTALNVYADDVRKHGAAKAVILQQVRLKTSNLKQHAAETWFDTEEFGRYMSAFIGRSSRFRLFSEMVDDGSLVRKKIDGVWHYRCAPAESQVDTSSAFSSLNMDHLPEKQSQIDTTGVLL